MFQLSLTGQYSRRALHYVNASMLYLMNFAYVSFALCNALGCIWYFTAITEGIEKSWLSSIGAAWPPQLPAGHHSHAQHACCLLGAD